MADVVVENRKALEADVIVPVTRHTIRGAERGFTRVVGQRGQTTCDAKRLDCRSQEQVCFFLVRNRGSFGF